MKNSSVTARVLEYSRALFEKSTYCQALTSNELIRLYLEKKQIPSRSGRWLETEEFIRFPVTSDGKTGPNWVDHFKEVGVDIGYHAKSILYSSEFLPTSGEVSDIVVLKGNHFKVNDLNVININNAAYLYGLLRANAEITCLICDMFADKEIEEMGFRTIVTMHLPIKDCDHDESALEVRRSIAKDVPSQSDKLLASSCVRWNHGWKHQDIGFAYKL